LSAETKITLQAVLAREARDQRHNRDAIAFSYLGNPGTDATNGTAYLMTQDHGIPLATLTAKPLDV
jgi:hypothetical protein